MKKQILEFLKLVTPIDQSEEENIDQPPAELIRRYRDVLIDIHNEWLKAAPQEEDAVYFEIGEAVFDYFKGPLEYAESLSEALHENNGKSSMLRLKKIIAERPVDVYSLLFLLNLERLRAPGDLEKAVRRAMGVAAAKTRLAVDPKQKEKEFVHECWREWKSDPSRYSSKAAFARDMLSKCQYLKSQKKIEDWCREWESAN